MIRYDRPIEVLVHLKSIGFNVCKICKKSKPLNNFQSNKTYFLGVVNECKDCVRIEFKERRRLLRLKFRVSKYKYDREYMINRPWLRAFVNAKQRCENKNQRSYYRYGGRGIKLLITKEEVEFLWVRDRAHLMEIPSLDRIDPDGNYEISNCRFIEMRENSRRGAIKRWRGVIV